MEIDYEKLEKFGIADDGKKKQFCPECHANRTNQRDKSLSVDWDKCIAHCHYCGKSFFFGKTEKIYHAPKAAQPLRQETKGHKKPGRLANEEPLDNNMKRWFEGRGIPVEVAPLRLAMRLVQSRELPRDAAPSQADGKAHRQAFHERTDEAAGIRCRCGVS